MKQETLFGLALLLVFSQASCQPRASSAQRESEKVAELLRAAEDERVAGNFDRALKRLEEAKNVYERIDAPHQIAKTLTLQANIHSIKAEYPKAERKLKRAAKIYAKTSGDKSLEYAGVLTKLGKNYRITSRYSEALKAFKQALAVIDSFPDARPDEVSDLSLSIGDVLVSQGRCDEALVFFNRALQLDQKRYPSDHWFIVRDLERAAWCLNMLGYEEQSVQAYKKVLAVTNKIFDDTDPVQALMLNNASIVLKRAGQHTAALDALKKAMAFNEKRYGVEHPYVGTNLHNIAYILIDLERYAPARDALEASYRIQNKVHPDGNAEMIYTLYSLSRAQKGLGDRQGAKKSLEQALLMADKLALTDMPILKTITKQFGMKKKRKARGPG